ncbi:nitrogenase component 1 [[Clostridium] polysaccharolyticum]|uniref:Nitrogenase molybdenum-iron protein beta chain n=1 Tax=[Clostridium] polysaccharolyticum TaxID=29364 RepID=A0A1I0B7B8_9FIRM|nr:nitrogenase component 1 [[Clostridium] polysaccharolyticum]SET02603.1 nitrogenase molybdenum-iron protein beta chain [[Clostridium] polysaccharolyticum]
MAKSKGGTIVHAHYACAVGAAYTVAAIKGGVPIANCGPGCMYKQFFFMSFDNGFQGVSGAGGGNVPSANVGENDIVFGGTKKLDALVQSSLAVLKGDLYVVLTGCSGELIGDDVGSVVRKYQKSGYPVVFADTGAYNGPKEKGLINLWFETPYFNMNWRGDYLEIVRILRGAGFKVNVLFGPESGGAKEWKEIPKAQFNLVLSTWNGLKIAKHLEKKYGQPYIHVPVIPIGEEDTTAFIRKLVEYAGIDKTQSEEFISQESGIYYYFLEHFSDFFSEYWYGLPAKFATIGNSSDNIALTKFLADQIGLIPVKQIITDNPPEKYRDQIRELYRNLSEEVSVEVEFLEDGYLVEQSLSKADFGSGKPLVLGSTWESDAARERDALLIEVSVPATETLVVNRSYIGYRGALTLLERIYSAAVGGK